MRSDKRIFIFSLLVILLILLSGISIRLFLQSNTNKLNKNINNIRNSISNNNWNSAHKSAEYLLSTWHKTERTWALFVNHHEIDNITSSLLKAVEYIKFNDQENANVYLVELAEYLNHIPDMEKLSLKNIL